MPANHSEIEKKLWASADELRVNDLQLLGAIQETRILKAKSH
jgi:hypothetical protein